jgi:hypothetical protein
MALKKNFFKGLQGGVNHSPLKMHEGKPHPQASTPSRANLIAGLKPEKPKEIYQPSYVDAKGAPDWLYEHVGKPLTEQGIPFGTLGQNPESNWRNGGGLTYTQLVDNHQIDKEKYPESRENTWSERYYNTPGTAEFIEKTAVDAEGNPVDIEVIKEMISNVSNVPYRTASENTGQSWNAKVDMDRDPSTGLVTYPGYTVQPDEYMNEFSKNDGLHDHEIGHFSKFDLIQGRPLRGVIGNEPSTTEEESINTFGDGWLSSDEKKYMQNDHESYGLFNELRSNINHKFGNEYTEESLQKLIDANPKLKQDRFLKAYKKEDVIKALNTIGDAPKSDGKMKFDFIKGKNNNERLA